MERLRVRFPNRKSITPAMLEILTFKEILTVRKSLPSKIKANTREYHNSVANVSEFLIERHSDHLDAETIDKLRNEAKFHRKESARSSPSSHQISVPKKYCDGSDTVIASVGQKNYRIKIKLVEIRKIERILDCSFCVPSIKKVNYVENFNELFCKKFIPEYKMRDYVTAFIYITLKLSGTSLDTIKSISTTESLTNITSKIFLNNRDSIVMLLEKVEKKFGFLVKVRIRGKRLDFLLKKDEAS